jgi:hypothetical protein
VRADPGRPESVHRLERGTAGRLSRPVSPGNPEKDGIAAAEYYRLLAKLSDNIISCDKQLMSKRKMLLDIDKENVMTVQSALRSIPKEAGGKEENGYGRIYGA